MNEQKNKFSFILIKLVELKWRFMDRFYVCFCKERLWKSIFLYSICYDTITNNPAKTLHKLQGVFYRQKSTLLNLIHLPLIEIIH